MSAIVICTSGVIPPPPIPCKVRPAISTAMLGASAEAAELKRQAEEGLERRLTVHGLAPGMTEEDYGKRLAFDGYVVGESNCRVLICAGAPDFVIRNRWGSPNLPPADQRCVIVDRDISEADTLSDYGMLANRWDC